MIELETRKEKYYDVRCNKCGKGSLQHSWGLSFTKPITCLACNSTDVEVEEVIVTCEVNTVKRENRIWETWTPISFEHPCL